MEDVEKVYSLFYSQWNSEKYRSLLLKFRITKKKRVRELSKGMQMKLMLACAFFYDVKLLILDEPTNGLYPVSRDELLEILSDYIEDGKQRGICGELPHCQRRQKGADAGAGEKADWNQKLCHRV